MFDDLESGEEVNFEWWLHSLSEMAIDSKQRSIVVSQGDARLKVLFLQSGKMDFEQFKGFPDPPEVNKNPMNVTMGTIEPDQWHIKVSSRPKSKVYRFITVLLPFERDNEPEVSGSSVKEKGDEICIELSINGKRHSVIYPPL